MDRVKIELKNCYGIKALTHEFDFKGRRAFAIYAANGVMKSSLAQTLRDAAMKTPSRDRIFSDRTTTRILHDETGADIEGDRIFVVQSYDETFGPSAKTSTLLVDAALRKEYSSLHEVIDEAKKRLINALKEQAQSKADFESEISNAFTSSGDEFETALKRISREVTDLKETPLADVKYDIIFDEKVLKALEPLKNDIESYVRRYNELLASSTYFKKGTFDYYNAGQIAKSLADNGFFDAKHTILLKSGKGSKEIQTQAELAEIVAEEKVAIISDAKLRKAFDEIAKKLEKNAELRGFCRYLQENEPVLGRMSNVAKLREDVLKSYLHVHLDLYLDLLLKYDSVAKRKAEIEEAARKQRTQWEEVIRIFNDRFFVPFKLEARNRTEVILGDAPIVDLGFSYIDGNESAEVTRGELLKVLSTGEKKALYVLNVIFEVETRRRSKQETLLVVDDIADSFDYQNKYAIIQYLKDINEDGLFRQIILTHNFDFFRTLESRFVGYPGCLMASKTGTQVTLIKAAGIRNVFANDWKPNFFSDDRKKLASICFLRNLIEMTRGEADPDYLVLTSMLHVRQDSDLLTVGVLDNIYNSLCGTKGKSANVKASIHDLLDHEATGCLTAQTGINLENKIVLAMATRIAAEKFMLSEIADPAFAASISSNQTQALIAKFKRTKSNNTAASGTLDKVSLMTPENIHVNSFMYEPILDMSEEHLKRLYVEVKALMP